MIALVEFLSDDDLKELSTNNSYLEATRKAAKEELQKRRNLKLEKNDI